MAKAVVELTASYADETTRKVELGPLAVEDADRDVIRTRIQNFPVASLSGIYLSDSGAAFTGITAAQITVSNEREINLN